MTNSSNKPTTLFWVIGVIALLWNIMGVVAYLDQAYITDEAIALLPEAEQAYYNGVPAWVTAAFAIAVFSGLLGCILLLMKKKFATSLFILSFITVIIQFIYNFFIQEFMELNASKMAMPIVVIIIAVFLVWYSKDSEKKGLLN
ncbi:hypothetical protein BX611_1209 [Lutibacter oceani]|uniref:Sugar transporter n=1 Tax=Lutibacter oceani TaxID=1853311 RepID=A0A3D9RVU7_9FLAO|nr:hypothetical protein [Lutibacter oceani]REE81674.1 hypothetical protein BX611_1209 [Lutibacter oceani]